MKSYARYLHIGPAQLFFDLGSNGKPRLPAALASSGVDFNLSHSNEMAIARRQPHRRARRRYRVRQTRLQIPGNRRAILHGARSRGDAQPADRSCSAQAFFKCWTSKEAFLKAKGTGLSGKLDEVEITRGALDQVRIHASVPGWSLTDLDPVDTYESALVVAGTAGADPLLSLAAAISDGPTPVIPSECEGSKVVRHSGWRPGIPIDG